jgi:RNA polymerase sigma-70 factor (ECF subfamily)
LKPLEWIETITRKPHDTAREQPLASAEAFADFYRDTHLVAYRYLYALSGGPAELAEDLTAECYLRAWKNRLAYRGDLSSATGWLLRIGRNLVIDAHRRSLARPLEADGMPLDELYPAAGPKPEEQAAWNEQQQMLFDQLHQLSHDAREVLILRYILDWKVNQIAAYLQIPENTVSVSIHRALEKVQRNWPVEEDEK